MDTEMITKFKFKDKDSARQKFLSICFNPILTETNPDIQKNISEGLASIFEQIDWMAPGDLNSWIVNFCYADTGFIAACQITLDLRQVQTRKV
jgi:hypothetical protein